MWFQKWNKTHLAVLLGYETIIWHRQSQNPGFSYDLMPVHCEAPSFKSFNRKYDGKQLLDTVHETAHIPVNPDSSKCF